MVYRGVFASQYRAVRPLPNQITNDLYTRLHKLNVLGVREPSKLL
jgi:hypothetical protein